MKQMYFPRVFLFIFFSILLFESSSGTSIVPVSVPQMTQYAGRIFLGTCRQVSEQAEDVPGLGRITRVEYTFTVSQTLKGDRRDTVSVRQIKTAQRAGTLMAGLMPTYQVGGRYLLFLTAESQLGLCAPVGLGQGAFRVITDAQGRQMALNGNHNLGLFRPSDRVENRISRPLSAAEQALVSHRSGPVELSSLLAVTTQLVKG